MKTPRISPKGILRLSTAALLASLSACGSGESDLGRSVPPSSGQSQPDASQAPIEIDPQVEKEQLTALENKRLAFASGQIENNYHHKGLGYYHAAARRFLPHPYNQEKEGKWFVNGVWQDTMGPEPVAASAPDEETLAALENSLVTAAKSTTATTTAQPHYGSSGLSHALLAYAILQGNRNRYTPSNPGLVARSGQFAEDKFRSARSTSMAVPPPVPKPKYVSPSSTSSSTQRGLFGTRSRSIFSGS